MDNWQKCPVCGGTGRNINYTVNALCGTCNGHGIISIISGAPPPFQKSVASSGTTTQITQLPCKDDEHEWLYFTDNFNSYQKCKNCGKKE